MYSTILRRKQLGDLFKEADFLIEVTSKDYTWMNDTPTLCLLVRDDSSILDLFYKIQNIYDNSAKVYVTQNPYDPLLSGNSMVWRNKWFKE